MEKYWCWLCSQKELYRPQIGGILQRFGNPKAAFEASDREIESCAFLTDTQRASLKREKREDCWYGLEKKGIKFISAEHPGYPKRLKEIPDYPYGLFFKGRLPLDQRPSVAIVGARKCSFYGKDMAEKLAAALARSGIQVISGMALGIDSYSQAEALEAGGESFAVLGCGVDICYPRRSEKLYRKLEEMGGILSEFPPGREPLPRHFPIRNRIISGLSETVLVIEARERSGSLITADLALEQGRDVLAVPGRLTDPVSAGCNRLIEQGAGIILSVEHLLTSLNGSVCPVKNKKNNEIPLETKEKLVYSMVDFQPVSLGEIIQNAKLPAQEAMQILAVLMLKGYVEEPMKNYYKKTN